MSSALANGIRNATAQSGLCRRGLAFPSFTAARVPSFSRDSFSSLRTMAVLVDYRGKPAYDIYVKGSPEVPELGDCPFSHRTMLTFEEKGIRYNKVLLDEQKLPEWIKDVCEGQKQIPFICELDTGKWMYDSDKIIPYLEDKYPEPPLGKPADLPQIDTALFPYFLEFVKTGGEAEEAQLLKELTKIDQFLGKSKGNFFGGKEVNALDLQIAPKLKHISIGAKAVHGWEIPNELANIKDYMQHISERESWKQTFYTEKYVSDGWKLKQKKLQGKA